MNVQENMDRARTAQAFARGVFPQTAGAKWLFAGISQAHPLAIMLSTWEEYATHVTGITAPDLARLRLGVEVGAPVTVQESFGIIMRAV